MSSATETGNGAGPTHSTRLTAGLTEEDIRRFGFLEEHDRCDGIESYSTGNGDAPAAEESRIVPLEEFVAIDEPGAEPLLGDERVALIPEGGDVMVYGDGGAGKTTLLFDLALHLAGGEDWLEIPVARAARLLLIENEGPRPLLRKKLARKLAAWQGSAPDGRVSVFERPWGQFTFADAAWRDQLATSIRELEIDVIIAGPLTRLGMDTAGTLQEVVAFMRLVADVRTRSARLLTVILVHHENKGGTVSGAWEGAGDTLLHIQAAGNGHTVVFIQKARWASSHHHKTLKLAWTDGEGFELEGDRDYVADVRDFLTGGKWRTAKEIAAPADEGGIAASEKTIRNILDERPDLFDSCTGDAAKALGRSPKATLWGLSSGLNSVDSVDPSQGGAEVVSASASALKDADTSNTPPSLTTRTEPTPELSEPRTLAEDIKF
jgi:hypothetical protein